MECVRCIMLTYLNPSVCKAWLINYDLPVYARSDGLKESTCGCYRYDRQQYTKTGDRRRYGHHHGHDQVHISVSGYPIIDSENHTNYCSGHCHGYNQCCVNVPVDPTHQDPGACVFDPDKNQCLYVASPTRQVSTLRQNHDDIAQRQLDLILREKNTTFEVIKCCFISMLSDLGMYYHKLKVMLVTDVREFILCGCNELEVEQPMIDVRPGTKEISKVLSQYSTMMYEYLHKLDWSGFKNYCQKLEVSYLQSGDADVRCLVDIYRAEESRCQRRGLDTLEQCLDVEKLLHQTECSGYLTVRLLTTKAAAYCLIDDNQNSVECYHQAAQVSMTLDPNMASAYSLTMFAIHGLLHQKNKQNIIIVPAEETWRQAEFYLQWGLEQHTRWVDVLREDPHISLDTLVVFFTWTLLKYGFLLTRTCITGDFQLLKSTISISSSNLRKVKGCLTVLAKDLKTFSVRAAIGVNLLACDLCIRHGQKLLTGLNINQTLAALWFQQGHRNASRAKLISGKMPDKRHANIGYEFSSRRMSYISESLEAIKEFLDPQNHNIHDEDYQSTLQVLRLTSLDEAQDVHIEDIFKKLDIGGYDMKRADNFSCIVPANTKNDSIRHIHTISTTPILPGLSNPTNELLTYPKRVAESTLSDNQLSVHLSLNEEIQTSPKQIGVAYDDQAGVSYDGADHAMPFDCIPTGSDHVTRYNHQDREMKLSHLDNNIISDQNQLHYLCINNSGEEGSCADTQIKTPALRSPDICQTFQKF